MLDNSTGRTIARIAMKLISIIPSSGRDRYGQNPETLAEEVFDKCFAGGPDRNEQLTTSEVADMLNCHYNTAQNHLEDLVFTGYLKGQEGGAE